jgi:hypothetical protein
MLWYSFFTSPVMEYGNPSPAEAAGHKYIIYEILI